MTSINYTDHAFTFTESLTEVIINEELKILAVPSVKKAICLIHKPWFLSRFYRDKSSIAISLRINEPVDHKEASAVASCNFKEDRPILIAFESPESVYLYWRINDLTFSLSLATQAQDMEKIASFIKKVLISELKDKRPGRI